MSSAPPLADHGSRRDRLRQGVGSPVVLAALTVVACLIVILPWVSALISNPDYVRWLVGIDADIYFDATRSWLQDGQWYLPRQLAGPYGITYGDVLYPPILLYLLVPSQLLPFILWWAIPLGAIALGLLAMRPPRWSLPLLILCLAWPLSVEQLIKGNPVLWVMAIATVCLARGWPLTLVLLKPSLAPFALPGIHRRSWWIVLGVMGLATLPFWDLALLYPQVILSSRGGGILYSIRDVPLLLLPVVAALASGRLHPAWPKRGRRETAPLVDTGAADHRG